MRLPHSTWYKAWILIGDIYDANTEADIFASFYHGLDSLVGHQSATYFPFGDESGLPVDAGYIEKNLDDSGQVALDYGSRYAPLDPLIILTNDVPANTALANSDVISFSRLDDTEFYVDFLKPLDIHKVMGTAIGVGGRMLGGIGIHRPRSHSSFTERDKTVLSLVAPHLARSLVNTRKRSEVNSWGAFELDDTCLLAMKRMTFTSREQEVAAGIVRGFSNKEIARHLSISEYTIKDHIRVIYKKTNAQSRTQFIRRLL